MPPGCQLQFTPRLHNQAKAAPGGAKMAPHNVSPVSSGGQGQENESGHEKTGREDAELKWMMACFKEYCFFDHKVPSLFGGGGGLKMEGCGTEKSAAQIFLKV